MIELFVIGALILQYVPACQTCGLGWLENPFSVVQTPASVDESTGALTVSTNESAWTVRTFLVVALLVAAGATAIFRRSKSHD